MRTFHTGGVAGLDITAGLPRVEELFEARVPKGKAEISHIDGVVEIIRADDGHQGQGHSRESTTPRSHLPEGAELLAAPRRPRRGRPGPGPREATAAATSPPRSRASSSRTTTGSSSGPRTSSSASTRSRTTPSSSSRTARRSAPATRSPTARSTRRSTSTPGARTPSSATWSKEVQKVYRSQGVTINDKHIEIIVRQMLRKVRIDQPGDTELLPTELIDRLDFEEVNNRVLAEGGEPATAQTVLLGRHQGVPQHLELPRGGVLPGDDPGAHRGGHQRRQGPPDRPQGERHHRQAHPGRDRRAGEPRRAQGARAAGGPRGPRRRGARGWRAEYNPFLEDGDARPRRRGAAGARGARSRGRDDEATTSASTRSSRPTSGRGRRRGRTRSVEEPPGGRARPPEAGQGPTSAAPEARRLADV